MNKPIYHITPEKGWMNDPNGLVEYNGVYHVFYQADPEHLINENIGWGHKISSDLLHWEECQPALLPDQSYDRDGCFTGSAVIKDDKMYLLYTGHVNQESGYIETQNLAVSKDGIHFEKYDGNPVIKNPPADTTMRFRDPKIWEKNGNYYAVIGGETEDKCGKVVYYRSRDLQEYTYCGVFADSDGSIGNMWECPNFVQIGNTDVLIISPKGLEKENGFSASFESGYMTGKMNYEEGMFSHASYKKLDHGFDFYAPQVFYGKDRQPMMFAWLGCGAQELPYAKEDMWIHSLTMPRFLTIKEGKLCQEVPENIKNEYAHLDIDSKRIKPEEDTWYINLTDKQISEIQIGDQEDHLSIKIDWAAGHIVADRSTLKHQFSTEYGIQREVSMSEELKNIEIYYDNTFIEIYLNDGKDTMTLRAFPENVEINLI